MDYKNHLYKTKLESFSHIAFEMEKTLNFYHKNLEDLKYSRFPLIQTELNANASSADDFIYDFSNTLVKYSICFPEKIVFALNDLSNCQYSPDSESLDLTLCVTSMENFIDAQSSKMNMIFNLIREDLNLAKMNDQLFK